MDECDQKAILRIIYAFALFLSAFFISDKFL